MLYMLSVHIAVIQAAVHGEYRNALCKCLQSLLKQQATKHKKSLKDTKCGS